MKALARILIILLAALVVVGVTVAVINSSGAAQAASSSQGGPLPHLGDGNFVPGQRAEGGLGGDQDGGSTLGWFSHLIPVAAIISVVVIIERLWRRIFRPRVV